MRLHVIVDFMHIYYKYFFQMRDGRLKKLTSVVNMNGTNVEIDTSLIYYSLRDIEGLRRQFEELKHDVTISVCFDSPSIRHEENAEYKSTRKKVLTDDNFRDLKIINELLIKAGYNTYKHDGIEADDLVNKLISEFKDNFDYSIIYTNDKDLLINICDNVGCMRFKATKGYSRVEKSTYEQYLENEYGVFIPYNALGLFLASVGDTADDIKGINKFGKVAFKKLITKISCTHNIDWSQCGDYNKLEEVIKYCKEVLTDEQYQQLKDSFELVRNTNINFDIMYPSNKTSEEKRTQAYTEFNMVSLIK